MRLHALAFVFNDGDERREEEEEEERECAKRKRRKFFGCSLGTRLLLPSNTADKERGERERIKRFLNAQIKKRAESSS